MLEIIQRFGKLCSCHLQAVYVTAVRFWKLYVGHAAGGEFSPVVLTGGAKQRLEGAH
jgi:hypothetical protein